MAGRHPDPNLIEECLDRPDELTPGLLAMLEIPAPDSHWMGEDPRWYGQVHAGKLLLAFRELEALPLFVDILRDPENETLLEWFDSDLHVLGPPAVPAFIDVMQDESAHAYGRHLSISTLRQIAHDHPEEVREQVLEVLRAELPPLSDDGEGSLDRDVEYEQIEHWTFVTLSLARLHDEQSRSRVEALYDADLIEEQIIGGLDDYYETLSGKKPAPSREFDILDEYARRRAREGTIDTSEPELVALLLDMLETAGSAPRPELIETCVHYQKWITPGLLEILEEDAGRRDQHWEHDDPRQYCMNHAGLLLIHFREEDALPSLVEEFRQSDAGTFNEWFEGKLRLFGPPAIPELADLLYDEDAGIWGRIEAVGELAHVGWAHSEARERVLSTLRGVLPPMVDNETIEVPEEVGEDQPLLWANVARELARLGDEDSRSHVEALFDHDLLDPMAIGDRDEYRRILQGESEAFTDFEPASYDVVEDYERRYQQKQKRRRREAERKWRQKRTEQERTEQATQGGHYEGGTFVRDEPKVGRNDPCPCGSGRKYKYCCG